MTRTSVSNRGGPPVTPTDFGGGGGGENSGDRGGSRKASLTGLFVLMAASVMTFASLFSALVVRRGLSNDWTKFPFPPILWTNTVVLLASSVVLDLARRSLKGGRRRAFNYLWWVGTLLGAGFLAGQIIAWRQLNFEGVYLAGNPSSSFFYVLTWAHAAHAVGGLAALIYVGVQALRYRLGPAKRTAVEVSTYFWHFLAVLWLGLMAIFLFWG